MSQNFDLDGNSANKHLPVLAHEVIQTFQNVVGVIVDGTLGGGGHTSLILNSHSNSKILACDYDMSAIEGAKNNLKNFVQDNRLSFFHGNFADLLEDTNSLSSLFKPPWNGALLDLGYSSNQLEDSNYGMSFQLDGPLDMRLSRPLKGPSAWDLLVHSTPNELSEILKAYAEISRPEKIVEKIKLSIKSGEITNSTLSLAQFLQNKTSGPSSKIHPATLIFQALRIAVNDELRNLDRFLKLIPLKLNTGAMLGIISFHSLEDRLVKIWGNSNKDSFEILTKKPIIASENEMKTNPRSRSAKLRVFKKR